jgi:zinc protease
VKLIVAPDRSTPLVSFSICAPGGTATDPLGLEGLTRHAAELARRGAGRYSRFELDEHLDVLGAALDMSVDRDSVALSGLCLEKHLDELIDLSILVLSEAHHRQDEHEKLIREAEAALDDLRDDDESLTQRFFHRHVRPGHPYARTGYGTDASLQRISSDLERVKAHVLPRFAADRLIIGFSGHVSEDKADNLATRIARSRPASHQAPPVDLDTAAIPRGRRLLVVDKPDRQQAQTFFGHPVPAYGDCRFAPLLCAEGAFGGGFSSRLVQDIRVKNGWSYGVGTQLSRARGPCWLRGDLAPSVENAAPALARTLDMYVEFATHGPTPDEFELARNFLIGSLPFSRATARQRMQSDVQLETYGLSRDYPDDMMRRLADMTVADIRRVARDELRPGDLSVVILSTWKKIAKAIEKLGWDDLSVVPWDSY